MSPPIQYNGCNWLRNPDDRGAVAKNTMEGKSKMADFWWMKFIKRRFYLKQSMFGVQTISDWLAKKSSSNGGP